jgi:non-heme chloroperoxidase
MADLWRVADLASTTVTVVEIKGVSARIQLQDGKPLLMLLRAAPVGMDLWEHIWPELAQEFSIVAPNLPTDWIEEATDGRDLFSRYGRLLVDVAQAMGYPRFHLLGWTGGACIGLRMLVDHPQVLLSASLIAPPVRTGENPKIAKLATRFVESITTTGDLAHYTWWWLLSSISQEYADANFAQLEQMVQRRLKADEGRFDPRKVRKWMDFQLSDFFEPGELANNIVPIQIVAPAFDGWAPLHTLRRLHARIPHSTLSVVPRGGGLFLWENPESFFASCGGFLTAAARGMGQPENTDAGLVSQVTHHHGTCAVFLHGWLMSPAIWWTTMKRLEDYGVRSVSLWQQSHGPLHGPALDTSLQDLARSILADLDTRGVQDCIVIGHSMGGMLGIELGKQLGSRLRGLGLISTSAMPFETRQRRELQASADALPLVLNPETALQYAASLLSEAFVKANPDWLSQWQRELGTYDLHGMSNLINAVVTKGNQQEDVKQLSVPLWVAHGALDKVLDVSEAATASRIYSAHFTVYDGVGHCPPLEQKHKFARDCVGFVLSCLQGASAVHDEQPDVAGATA